MNHSYDNAKGSLIEKPGSGSCLRYRYTDILDTPKLFAMALGPKPFEAINMIFSPFTERGRPR